jgi:arabinose-5-phosphate isomerase
MTKIIKDTALRTIQIEIEALEALKASINNDFISVVELIAANKGRVIVTGIGKSAIVAQKIVATLNSTGTPSVFMHAADAIHGDLGMIQQGDTVIVLSKSGDTPEIKALIPLVKNFGNPLIGMVSNLQSALGIKSDYLLHTPIDQEADPNNLAPTASTTAQMAMGDALATSLLALKGFSSKDFAQFHPGGALGKQLYLRVRDIYVLHEKPQVMYSDNLQTIILEMTSKRLGAAVVLNANMEIVGIITDGDLRRMLGERSLGIGLWSLDSQRSLGVGLSSLEMSINSLTDTKDQRPKTKDQPTKDQRLKTRHTSNSTKSAEDQRPTNELTAETIMSKNPTTIDADTLAVEALQMMRERSITQLIVADGKTYLGMVHLHDLLKEGIV